LDVGTDFIDLSSSDLTETELSSNLLSESNTSGAVDASCHRSLDKWSNFLVLNSSLILHHSSFSISVDSRNVLQITLSSLVANRAIKWMVGKQKLHNTTSCDSSFLTLGNNFKIWSDVGGTSSEWLWSSLDLHQTHSTVSSDRESLVIAESWDLNSSLGTGLEDSV